AFDSDVKRIVKSTFPEGTAPSTGRQGSFADAIAKLRAHRELAPQFDERYGKGMAQRYLGEQ
ncbi:MAG: hypothetical protein ACWGQW_08265, partial [bacterium]